MEPYIHFRADPADLYELFLLSGPGQCLDEEPYHCRWLVGADSSGAKLKMTEI